jgi:gas vesicle protein
MADKAGKGGASGFLPGLVLGVVIGAVTAFVALELLDSPRIDVEARPGATTGERIESGVEEAGDAVDEMGDAIEDAAESAEETLEDITPPPPADPAPGNGDG